MRVGTSSRRSFKSPGLDRSLTDNTARAASDILWTHWQNGTRLDTLPRHLRPADRVAGYGIQGCLDQRSESPVYGWKIAATSVAGQKHIGVDGPLAGRLLSERVHSDGALLSLEANAMRVVEAEFAFRIGRDLPPQDRPFSVDEVTAATADLHLALEIPDSRYVDFAIVGGPLLIADNACAHEFVLGPRAKGDWRAVDLASQPVIGRVNDMNAHNGSGENVLGDPRIALTWLANELSELGITLRAGQIVTTGTCIVPMPIAPGDRVRAEFGSFGSVSATFATG